MRGASFHTLTSWSRVACRSAPGPTSSHLSWPKLPSPPRSNQRCRQAYSTTSGTRTGERTIKLSHAFAATTLLCSTSYVIGWFVPPPFLQLINPRPAPPPLAADSEDGRKYTEKMEGELHSLELLKRCREREDADDWYETRPYVQLPPERMANNFSAGALRGPGKIVVPPLVRAKKDETEAWVFLHLGRGVCGHDGIVHGGLLATLLDEGCGRNAVLAFPSRVAVTANLVLDYKAPTKADQFVVMKTRLVELKGRKAVVEGQVEDLHGNVLVQARVLFVEPKLARALGAGTTSAMFPSARDTVDQMTGARSVEGGGQVTDKGVRKSR